MKKAIAECPECGDITTHELPLLMEDINCRKCEWTSEHEYGDWIMLVIIDFINE